MHQYARYFERFRQLSHNRPLVELVPEDTLARFSAEVEAETASYGGMPKPELELERDIRARIDNMYYETFQHTQEETTKRWTYESELKRPYFHVTELDNSQMANWRKYLDFEESEGDFSRITFLYERCLVTCALYDEFWFRYAQWMSSQPDKEEEVRHIYMRAATLFVPISRPGIRLQFAYFEESCGRADVARDIHEAILTQLPDCVEAIVSWANLQRRQSGLDAAIEVYKAQIDAPQVDIFTKAVLVTQWAFLLWKIKGSVDEARTVFVKNVQWYADSRLFWLKWLEFELEQPTSVELEPRHAERMKHIFDELRVKSRISAVSKKGLFLTYLTYLQERGDKDAMKQFLVVQREIYGYVFIPINRHLVHTTNKYHKTRFDVYTQQASCQGERRDESPVGRCYEGKGRKQLSNVLRVHCRARPQCAGNCVLQLALATRKANCLRARIFSLLANLLHDFPCSLSRPCV
jgi:pre-mRNA-processing factor 39